MDNGYKMDYGLWLWTMGKWSFCEDALPNPGSCCFLVFFFFGFGLLFSLFFYFALFVCLVAAFCFADGRFLVRVF